MMFQETTTNATISTAPIHNTTLEPFLNPITNTKIGMAIGLLVTVFIVTLLPVFLVRYLAKRMNLYSEENQSSFRKFQMWMSIINCFAGGVFMSTGFMDVFPEMLESIEDAKSKNKINLEFPLGPFLTLLGFFLILLLEETITACRKNCCKSPKSFAYGEFSNPNYRTNELENDRLHDNESNHNHDFEHDHDSHHNHDHGLDKETLSKGNLTVTILMVAISIHSIFEGLTLGLEKDKAGATRLFLALCLHKYVIAITIGIQLASSTLKWKMFVLCATIFSCATPLGTVLGFWVIHLERVGNTSFSIVAAVLQGLSCGTFFYIVFFEILPEELNKKGNKWFKIIAMILGFALVSIVMYAVHE